MTMADAFVKVRQDWVLILKTSSKPHLTKRSMKNENREWSQKITEIHKNDIFAIEWCKHRLCVLDGFLMIVAFNGAEITENRSKMSFWVDFWRTQKRKMKNWSHWASYDIPTPPHVLTIPLPSSSLFSLYPPPSPSLFSLYPPFPPCPHYKPRPPLRSFLHSGDGVGWGLTRIHHHNYKL